MSFTSEPITEISFKKIDDVYAWAEKEQNNLTRIPVHGCLKRGAKFLDDEYFGDEYTAFKFNQSGIRSLCSDLGIRFDTLELLERQNLATEVLNDLLAQRAIQEKLQSRELIVDEPENRIIGIVSKSYVGYSNFQLLQDITDLMNLKTSQRSLLPIKDDFDFREAYSINSQMSIRFTMQKEVGIVKGLGGDGTDKTMLGFQLKNSMVGDSSINMNFFLHRIICANGLVAPAGSSVNRVFHSGRQDKFLERLTNAFREVTCRVEQAGKMIEQLSAIEFNPTLLAKANRSEMIFDIIQGSKGQILDEFKISNTAGQGNKEENKIQREAKIISHIPDVFGGEYSQQVFTSKWRDNASMFDFINIFTEHAKKLSPSKKIESEEKAGILADWIAKNKRKF